MPAQLAAALVHEREAHMAFNLKWHPYMQGAKCVVGVAPKEHIRGIVYHLMQVALSACSSHVLKIGVTKPQSSAAFLHVLLDLTVFMLTNACWILCYLE